MLLPLVQTALSSPAALATGEDGAASLASLGRAVRIPSLDMAPYISNPEALEDDGDILRDPWIVSDDGTFACAGAYAGRTRSKGRTLFVWNLRTGVGSRTELEVLYDRAAHRPLPAFFWRYGSGAYSTPLDRPEFVGLAGGRFPLAWQDGQGDDGVIASSLVQGEITRGYLASPYRPAPSDPRPDLRLRFWRRKEYRFVDYDERRGLVYVAVPNTPPERLLAFRLPRLGATASADRAAADRALAASALRPGSASGLGTMAQIPRALRPHLRDGIRDRRSASYRYVMDRDTKNRDVEYDLVRGRSRPLPKGPGPGYWDLFYLGDDLLIAWVPTPPKGAAAESPDPKAAAGTSSGIVPLRYYFWDRATGRLREYEGPSIVGQSPSGRFVVARTGSRDVRSGSRREDAPTWLVDRGRR